MNTYHNLYQKMNQPGLDRWLKILPAHVENALAPSKNANLPHWKNVIDDLTRFRSGVPRMVQGRLTFGAERSWSPLEQQELEGLLRTFHPWRKGPFNIGDIHVDTEWRSDLKWDRVINHISPLAGRTVLDVGSGNGYHCWRMVQDGATLAIGVDPYLMSIMQFLALDALCHQDKVFVIPARVEDIPSELGCFDTVFSMGLLYHRKSPIEHLFDLRDSLKKGGELVLETLVVEGGQGIVLVPEGRYAKMRNVWFVPSPETLAGWMRRVGFVDVRVVDVTKTSILEQRSTEWMKLESLPDFLDPRDDRFTIEGHPAPVRAVLVAEKP